MEENKQNHLSFAEFAPETITFFVVLIPKASNFKMEMRIGHPPGKPNKDTIDKKFNQISLNKQISRFENVTLFSLALTIYTNRETHQKFLFEGDSKKQIWEYQIRVSHDTRVGNHFYFEPEGKSRKLPNKENEFLFDFSLVENKEYMFSKNPQCELIVGPLDQAFAWILFILETNRPEILEDMILQHRKHFGELKDISADAIRKYYSSLQEYLRTKSSTAIQERSDIILGIICLLGLLPEGAEVNFKIGLPKIGDILEIFEDSLIEIVCSKKDPVILNVIARGLCYLFVLEEHEKQTSNWIQFLQELHKRVNKMDNSVKEQKLEYFLTVFFKLAQVAKIRIRKENIEDIYSFEPNLFRDHPEIVTFAQNLLEFSRMIKQILLSQFMELNYPGEASPELPQRLSEDQKRIVYNVGYKIPGWFEKCQEKDGEDSDFLMSVQEVSFFLKELEDNIVIKDMFGSIDDSCKILCASLRRAEINQKTVDGLFSIINYKDKDHFLMDLNIPEYLKDKICSDQCIGNFEFYLKIFRYFIAKMSLVDFEQTLPKWVKRIQNRDRLLENLDSLCAELIPTSDLDYECFDKTGSLIGKVIDLFREDSYREKIEFFIRKVHNEDALRVYEQLVIEEINECDLDYLTTKNTHNPLLLLHKLAKKYPGNTLVQRLIRYCLTKIPENLYGNIDYVRTHLFQEPKRTSLLYLVLQKQVFKESEIYESFQSLCCSIITEIQELKIESKWILMVDKLSFEQKTILYEQLNKVIEENSLMTEDNENKIDVAEILESYKNEWSNNISMLESFRSFINVYCTKAIDFWQHVQILDECIDKVEKKEIKNSQQFAKEIKMFDKYIKQLNPLKDSQTFEFYRKELFSKDKRLTCKEQAERTLEAAQNFKLKLIKLIENPLTTVRHLLDFFVGINDTGIKAEAQILSKSLGEEKSQWLLEILNFIEEKEDVKKLCRGLLACAGLFSLDNKIVEVVERGCRLSVDDIANEFHYVNKTIKDRFNLTPKSGVYNILTEFEGSEELLKFSLKVTVSEISLMKEAVLDSEYTLLKCDEIFYFGEFWRIVTSLKRNVAEKPDKPLEQYLSELLHEKTYFVFLSDLRASKASFLKIQDFYSELMNKTEFKVNQICNIIDKSLVEIEKSDQDFDIIIKYKNSRTYEKEFISLRRMFYLQHYARVLVSYKTKETQGLKEEELNKISSFLFFVDTIEQIIAYLRELDENGYPSLMNLKVTTLNQPIIEAQFRCNQSTFDSLQKFSNQLEALSKQWKNTVFDAYEKHYSLTFFSKKEIWEVEDILTGLHKEKESKVAPFLKFLKQVKEFKSEFQIVGRYPAERLRALGEALEYVVPDKNMNLFGEIDSQIKFYIVEINQNTVIKGLLSLYYHGTPLLPKPFQVLTCSSTTSWGQLAAFTFRCFFNPNCELFCLVNPELLALELQTKLLNLLQELDRKYSQQKFKLGFITSEMQSPLIKSILKEEHHKVFDDRKLLGEVELRNKVQDGGINCRIVTSRVPGLGKTFWIKSHIKDKSQNLVKIPISGDFEQGMFGHKMTSVLAKNVPVLCFQIGTVTDFAKPLLNKFFFNLVVWRVYYDLDTIRGIPEDMQIFIEIDIPFSGPLLSEIELLQFLPTKHFEELDWEELDFESPEIQFVCHYLESLANGTIQTEDLYENDVKDAIMSKEDCKKLLSQRFLKGKDPKSVTYAQLDTFIQTLYAMLESFSENVFLSCDFLKPEENKEASNIRVNFIESIIIAAQELLPKPIEEIQDYQKEVEILQPHSRKNSFSQQNKFSWENSTPFTIFMSSDNLPVFIYKNLKDAPQMLVQSMQQFAQILEPMKGPNDGGLTEYKDCGPERLFEILFKNLSKSSLTKNVCLLCHRQENNEVLICPDCNSPMLINSGDEKSFLEKLAVESVKDYVLTTDNFLKMMLIFVKIEYQIPIIISGESACGKTSLIKFLCQRILNHEYYSFLIHGGITQERVLADMNRFILKANDMLKAGLGKKIWIVFKDFNTTECNELLSEIICEKTMLGQHLPENLVLIGTCDLSKSMRNQKQSLRNKSLVKSDRNKSMNKVYYPLSGAAVSFIWDFGQLTLEMENKYIQKKLDDLAIFQSINLRNDTIELVMAAHHRMKQEPYGSSISLRDVDRYMTLLDWFINSLTLRNRHKSVLLQQAIILALAHCYYFRIDSREKRDQFLDEMEPYSKKLWMNRNDVEDLIQQQEINFIERMNPLPSGIVKNVDLLENVYTLIVCICTKIPVLLSGQSGTSKSLALQLIFNNLRGKNSRDSYFKMLPEFVPILYQNISSSVSENILDVFRRAGKYTAISATNIEIRPVVIFDGLDPDLIMENNPLNAWQNKFELENVEPSFVYVSHTKCDIAEMNRAVHVALPEPDIKDYELAAEEIYKNIVKGQAPKKGLFRSLARVFSDLNQLVVDHRIQSYIGLGDYYSFLKELSLDMSKIEKDDQTALKNSQLYSVVNKNIKKSFGAVEDLYKSLWTNFCNYMRQNEDQVRIEELLSKDLITENIQEKNSRHLMLITKQEVRIECFDEFVRGNIQNKSSETLIGSDMANDLEDAKYSLQIFKKLTIYREKGYSLIFKKFTRMLPLIQDLLNNKLSWNRDKRHLARNESRDLNPEHLLEQGFHCIVFVSEEEVRKIHPSVLKWFEKHRIGIEDIADTNDKVVKQELVKWIDLTINNSNTKMDLVGPEMLFADYDSDFLFSMILSVKHVIYSAKQAIDYENVLKLCKDRLRTRASFDFAIKVSLNNMNEEDQLALINQYYQEKGSSFKEICQETLAKSDQGSKIIVYTYTQITESLAYPDSEFVKEIILRNFNSEKSISSTIKQLMREAKNLLVIRVDFVLEKNRMLLLHHLLTELLTNFGSAKRPSFIIIVHLQRCSLKATFTSIFQDWDHIMIDSLNGSFTLPKSFLSQPALKKLISSDLMPSLDDLTLVKMIEKCLLKVSYNVPDEHENKVIARRENLFKQLNMLTDQEDRSVKILELVREKVMVIISNIEDSDWRKAIIQNPFIKASALSPIEAIQLVVQDAYESALLRIVYEMENEQLFDSYFQVLDDGYLFNIWCNGFQKHMKEVKGVLDEQLVEVDFVFGLEFPFSHSEHKKIAQIQEQIKRLEDETSETAVNKASLATFTGLSLFEESFFEEVFSDENWFEKYFRDQLLLFLEFHNISLGLKTVYQILKFLYQDCSNKDKFKFFLENGHRLYLVFEIAQVLLTMPEGPTILSQSFNDQELENNKGEKNESDSLMMIKLLFKNIISQICSPKYLEKITYTNRIQSAFLMIHDKITKSEVNPDNTMGVLSAWTYLLNFLKNFNLKSKDNFIKNFNWLATIKGSSFLSSPIILNSLLSNLKSNVYYTSNLSEFEKTHNMFKIQAQLYANLVRSSDHRHLEEILSLIDREQQPSQLWKFSERILECLDEQTDISMLIWDYHGNLTSIQRNPIFEWLESIIRNNCNKLPYLLSNKIFVKLVTYCLPRYKEILPKYFNDFEDNLAFLEQAMDFTKSRDWKKNSFTAFLGSVVWVKVYLYLYSLAIDQHSTDISVLKHIDYALEKSSSKVLAVKTFVLNCLKLGTEKSLQDLQDQYSQRNISWIKPCLGQFVKEETATNIISPLPLHQETYLKDIDDILQQLSNAKEEKVMQLFLEKCRQAQQDYALSVCIYSWFLRFYTNYMQEEFPASQGFIKLFTQYKLDLSKSLGDMGFKFVDQLLKNFDQASYFSLQPNLTREEVHQRLTVLNILISVIALQNSESTLSSLLFENKQLAKNLSAHLNKKFIFGQMNNSAIATDEYKKVKTSLEECIKIAQISSTPKTIYKCSKNCDFFFCVNDPKNVKACQPQQYCKICGSHIGLKIGDNYLQRSVKMSLDETKAYLNEFTEKTQAQLSKGYVVNNPDNNNYTDTKPMITPITFRVLHFILHSALFGLSELEYTPYQEMNKIISKDTKTEIQDYLKKHFSQDYDMIAKLLRINSPYIWLNQIIFAIEKSVHQKNDLSNLKALNDFEKYFEEDIILPRIKLPHNITQDYCQSWAKAVGGQIKIDISEYREEFSFDIKESPGLEYFNYVKLPTFTDLQNKFLLVIGGEKLPLTAFFLRRYKELQCLSMLSCIVKFLNHLKDKVDYRISRDRAGIMPIKDLFKEDSVLERLFKELQQKWNSMNFAAENKTKVYQKIDQNTRLSLLIPTHITKGNDNLMTDAMRSLIELHNELVYLAKCNENPLFKEKMKSDPYNTLESGKITANDIIDIDKDELLIDIIRHNCINHYEFGKGQDIIYNFEEVENQLFKIVTGKKIINNDNLITINYKLEVCREDLSPIIQVYNRNNQKPLGIEMETRHRATLNEIPSRELLTCLSNLNDVFAYLSCTTEDRNAFVKDFFRQRMVNYSQQASISRLLSKIPLKYAVSFYQILEETIFNKIFRNDMKLMSTGISLEEKEKIVGIFNNIILRNGPTKVMLSAKNRSAVARMFKRLMIRISKSHVDLDRAISEYVTRKDLWLIEINVNLPESLTLDDELKLKHLLIMVDHLESGQTNHNSKPAEIPSPLKLRESDMISQNKLESLLRGTKKRSKI